METECSWAEAALQNSSLPGKRLYRRLAKIVETLSKSPLTNVAQRQTKA